MKKLLAFLILFLASSALAQSAKVLVCAPGNLAAAKSTDSVLAKFYSDPIDVSDTITENINNYKAVFLLSVGHRIDSGEEILLKAFLHGNKKLYVENFYGDNDSNVLLHYVGITSFGTDLVNFGVHFVQGAKGTFTEGLFVENKKYSPIDDNFNSLYIYGNVKLVLSPLPDPSIAIAVAYETDSFKVVLHYPILQDYYEEFLHRVICNYFGLCTPASVKQTAENISADISLFPNPARDMLHIFGSTGLQSATLYSATGSFITRFSLNPNASRFELDLSKLNLASGNYLLNIETPKESFLKKVLLLK